MAKSILIIEDSPLVRGVYKTHFEKQGYLVREAANGKAGFEIAKSHHPDIILLDIIMPQMGGLGVLDQLKNDYNTMNIPVIILTSAEREDEKQEAMEMGAVAYVLKSAATPETLERMIREQLSE